MEENPAVTDFAGRSRETAAMLVQGLESLAHVVRDLREVLHGDSQSVSMAYLSERIKKMATELEGLRRTVGQLTGQVDALREAVYGRATDQNAPPYRQLLAMIDALNTRIDKAAHKVAPLLERYQRENEGANQDVHNTGTETV